jgi:GNAT superfamily N-acetyltransferase
MISAVEWFGYGASVVVAVSLLMSSLVRLRWINLAGSLMFTAYGALIGAYPVAGLNFAIACINVYHLQKIYGRREQFRLVPTTRDNPVLDEFLRIHGSAVAALFPGTAQTPTDGPAFLALRNGNIAGALLTRPSGPETLEIVVDYVTPEYRDFQVGRFVFEQNARAFRDRGFTRLVSAPNGPEHEAYLRRMGFAPSTDGSRLLVRSV